MFLLALRGKNMVTDPPHSPCSRLYEALSGESHGPTNHPDSSCFQCFNSVTTNHFGSKKNALLSWQFPRNTPPINHYYWFEVIYIYMDMCIYVCPCISMKGTFFGTTFNPHPPPFNMEGQRFGRASSCKTSATSIGCSSWTWVWNLIIFSPLRFSTQPSSAIDSATHLLEFKWWLDTGCPSISGEIIDWIR